MPVRRTANGLLISLLVCLPALVLGEAQDAGQGVVVEAPELVPDGSARIDLPALDAAALSDRLAGLETFAASFIQAIAGNRGQILEQSTGYVLLDRPNFKWVVDAPYPQVIVTEGDSLKVYDPDLEQLTIRPLADALTDTPISLLTSTDVDLSEKFQIIRLPLDEDGVDSYVVSPLGEETLFAEIRLAFSGTGLDSLGIVDHLGQYTEIRFQVDADRVIQSADFELEVPPETDVIGG